MKNKHIEITIIFVLCLISVGLIIKNSIEKKNDLEISVNETEKEEECEVVFFHKNLYNGDAKFYQDYIITQVGGKLMVLSKEGAIIKRYEDVNANWIAALEEENSIIVCSSDNITKIIKLDDDLNVEYVKEIFDCEDLQIDPTIVKIEDQYYITVTRVVGTPNNANVAIENGQYTISLYSSTDFENWTYITDIVSEKSNLEDGIMYYKDGVMYFIFEKEVYDKKNSSICMKTSKDRGLNWGETTILIPENADNEPAYFYKTGDGYKFYYSSDKKNPGESYNGASIYVTEFDNDFIMTQESNELAVNHKGDLLYDVRESQDDIYLLFTQNYLSDSNLVLEKYKKPRK